MRATYLPKLEAGKFDAWQHRMMLYLKADDQRTWDVVSGDYERPQYTPPPPLSSETKKLLDEADKHIAAAIGLMSEAEKALPLSMLKHQRKILELLKERKSPLEPHRDCKSEYELKSWIRHDAEAKHYIASSLDDDTLAVVANATSAKDMWTKLAALHQNVS